MQRARISDSSKTSKNLPSYWWDENCTALFEENKALAVIYRQNPTIENQINYYTTKERNHKKLREIKQVKYIDTCNNLNINSNPAKVWKFFGNIKNKIEKSNMTVVSNNINQEAVDRAFDKIAPHLVYRDEIVDGDLFDNQPHHRDHNEVLTNPITRDAQRFEGAQGTK